VSVHLVRGSRTGFVELKAPIESVQRSADGWDGVTGMTLTVAGLPAKERQKVELLEPGQPVHLALDGADMTGFAFDTTVRGFGKYIVTLGVLLFAFSTMISWSYYGEKGAEYPLGPQAILPFKFIFVIFVFLGMVLPEFKTVYDFADATAGMMVLCNLPAVIILSPTVLRAARSYFHRLDAGQMPRMR
jgi:Na+/alanine symporter